MPMTLDGMNIPVEFPVIIAGVFAVLGLIGLLTVIATCKVYIKAGRKWWEAIIPIYNIVVWCDMIQKSRHFIWPYVATIALMFMGEEAYMVGVIGNAILGVWLTYRLVRKFGKGVGFTVGSIILPFIYWPILAWGKSTYDAKRN